MPVDDRRLRQRVVQAGRELRAAFDAQDRVLVRLTRVFGLVQQERRALAWQQWEARGDSAYLQRPGEIEDAEGSAGNRMNSFC